jgi:uncharacterized membrane protein
VDQTTPQMMTITYKDFMIFLPSVMTVGGLVFLSVIALLAQLTPFHLRFLSSELKE